MFLWIINIIIMNFIITISFLSIRKIIFYYKNICYFCKKNIYQKINLNKYFKKLKKKNKLLPLWIILGIIGIISFLILLIWSASVLIKHPKC